ncbi:CHRD domain-containing protein [Bosea sp. 2YAB26]|uniref:CHRD domain-containing protein n=1 Tax=Bosea sp. 2YAB26 TaxID=3237478 RepID=UPI003F8D93C1
MLALGVTSGPFEGSATLTDDQAQALIAGQTYFNVHTAANPNGEMRGQVTRGHRPPELKSTTESAAANRLPLAMSGQCWALIVAMLQRWRSPRKMGLAMRM